MNTIDIQGKPYEVTGYADDGLPIIRGVASTTQDGFDPEGNPKISVNITVPAASLFAEGGEQG